MSGEHGADSDAPMWCDGTPHSPAAIPPLPFHDWRYDLDNPWLICARCGERRAPIRRETAFENVARQEREANGWPRFGCPEHQQARPDCRTCQRFHTPTPPTSDGGQS